jgi:hypothetical protein
VRTVRGAQVLSLNASLRGSEAHDAALDASHSPALYVTFHTDELETLSRYWLWVGVPVGYLLLSCCCCCFLCLCSIAPAPDKASRTSELDLADLAQAMPDEDELADSDDDDAVRQPRH